MKEPSKDCDCSRQPPDQKSWTTHLPLMISIASLIVNICRFGPADRRANKLHERRGSAEALPLRHVIRNLYGPLRRDVKRRSAIQSKRGVCEPQDRVRAAARVLRRIRREGVLVGPGCDQREDRCHDRPLGRRAAGGREAADLYGGGQLGRDLTLPRLCDGWEDTPQGATAAAPNGTRPNAVGRWPHRAAKPRPGPRIKRVGTVNDWRRSWTGCGPYRLRMATRDLIGQAKGILMQQYSIDSDQAFRLLTRISQNTNELLRNVAEQLITTRQIRGLRPPHLGQDAPRRPPEGR